MLVKGALELEVISRNEYVRPQAITLTNAYFLSFGLLGTTEISLKNK